MYTPVLALHSVLRWLVLAVGVLAVARAIAGTTGRKPWTPADESAGRWFVIALDAQLGLGLLLYTALSPVTRAAFADFGAAMRTAPLRYFAVEHVMVMVLALALVHVGKVRVRRQATDAARHRTAAIFFGLGLLLILAGIPWPFMAAGRPLLPAF